MKLQLGRLGACMSGAAALLVAAGLGASARVQRCGAVGAPLQASAHNGLGVLASPSVPAAQRQSPAAAAWDAPAGPLRVTRAPDMQAPFNQWTKWNIAYKGKLDSPVSVHGRVTKCPKGWRCGDLYRQVAEKPIGQVSVAYACMSAGPQTLPATIRMEAVLTDLQGVRLAAVPFSFTCTPAKKARATKRPAAVVPATTADPHTARTPTTMAIAIPAPAG